VTKREILKNGLEGIFWTPQKRLKVMEKLYKELYLRKPPRYKPFVKSFNSFKEYEKWRKRQKDPWLK